MNTMLFIENFLKSEFAKNNIFLHLQAGFPVPILHKNGLVLRLFFHKLNCTSERVTLSAPIYEVALLYPSSRIVRFIEINETDSQGEVVVIPNRKIVVFKRAFERSFSACDEVFAFYDAHGKVTPIVLQEHYQVLEKNASDIGLEQWYGGLYDNNSSI